MRLLRGKPAMKNGRPNLFIAPSCDQSSKVVLTLPRYVVVAIELRWLSVQQQ
jgi:hypothetical protein